MREAQAGDVSRESLEVTSVGQSSPHGDEREGEGCQVSLTPIIEGQHYLETSPASIGEFPNYLNLESVARLSYTPVYRTANSFNKSP